jgi:hypothetical protein
MSERCVLRAAIAPPVGERGSMLPLARIASMLESVMFSFSRSVVSVRSACSRPNFAASSARAP